MTEKRVVHDKYGFVVEVPTERVEPQEDGITRGLKNMFHTVMKPNPALWGELDRMAPEDALRHRMLKALIRECGIPEPLRQKFWPLISGAEDLRKTSRVVYRDIISTLRSFKNESTEQIEKDLSRSFPGHKYFESPQGMKSLRNVLTAFSWLNPVIGYTQSMNFWAGLMLLFVRSEESVFWLVVTVVEKILPAQYYDQSMLDIIVDNQVVFALIEMYLPRVHQHISSYTTDLSPILTQWFLCLYVNTLPTELTLRVLDCFLYEGNKILLRVALGIFKYYETEILKTTTFEDLFLLIAKPLKIQDVDGFMNLIFDRIWLRAFGREKLGQLRQSIKTSTAKLLEERNQQRTARSIARKAAQLQQQQSSSPLSTSPNSPLASPPKSPSTLAACASPSAFSESPKNANSTAPDATVSDYNWMADLAAFEEEKRRTMRASALPEEVKDILDRKSWRAHKKSEEWEILEEYVPDTTSPQRQATPTILYAPNVRDTIIMPLSVSDPESVPKASKTKLFKATTIAGSTVPVSSNTAASEGTSNMAKRTATRTPPPTNIPTSPAPSPPAVAASNRNANPSSTHSATPPMDIKQSTAPKRRSYAEAAKAGAQMAAPLSSSPAPTMVIGTPVQRQFEAATKNQTQFQVSQPNSTTNATSNHTGHTRSNTFTATYTSSSSANNKYSSTTTATSSTSATSQHNVKPSSINRSTYDPVRTSHSAPPKQSTSSAGATKKSSMSTYRAGFNTLGRNISTFVSSLTKSSGANGSSSSSSSSRTKQNTKSNVSDDAPTNTHRNTHTGRLTSNTKSTSAQPIALPSGPSIPTIRAAPKLGASSPASPPPQQQQFQYQHPSTKMTSAAASNSPIISPMPRLTFSESSSSSSS